MPVKHYDIVIVGAGYAGLGLAVALKVSAPSLSVCVVDRRHPKTAIADERAFALTASAVSMLERLGIWTSLKPLSQPILKMTITDSDLQDVLRPVFLTFDSIAEDASPLGFMVANGDLIRGLLARAQECDVDLIAPGSVASVDHNTGSASIVLDTGESLSANLIVGADGAKSKLRQWAGIKTTQWYYDQVGLVANVRHDEPHHGEAIEHFLPSGPFAILPLTGNRSSLVWTEKPEIAKRLVEGDDFSFSIELERRFGHKLGAVEVEGGKQVFPLGLTLARHMVEERLALIGDAAHVIHPVAGQGLNLGFKDIAALTEVIVQAQRLGEDYGQSHVLERYQQWRRFDVVQMALVTDGLNHLFSNRFAPLRIARDFGLGLVDRMPGLKSYFMREASGASGDAPQLLSGQLP